MKFKSDIEIQAGVEAGGSTGSNGQVLSSTGSGVAWIDQNAISAGNAEHVVIYAKNTHTASIAKGTPVYITGTVGATDTVEIAPADASDSAKMPAVGLLDETLAVNAFGYVITGGFMDNITTDPIDGATPSSNDTVYVKAGGGLTLTKPTGPTGLIQNVAKVGKVSGGNSGSLIVSSILRTNDVPNLTTGKIWVGDGNTVESTVVHLDEANGRMGIGTDSPGSLLHIKGADPILTIQDTSTGTASASSTLRLGESGAGGVLDVYWDIKQASDDLNTHLEINHSSNGNHFTILDNGNVGIGTTSPGAKLEVKTPSYNAANAVANFINGNDPVRVSYDTVVIAQTDVPTLSIVETIDGSQASEQKLTFSVGDNKAVIASTSTATDGMYFNVNRDTDAPAYNTGNGITALNIKNNGNVGIGTTSPLNPLSIESSSSPLIKIRNTTNGGGAAIEFNDNGTSASTQNGIIKYVHSDTASQGGGSSFVLEGENDQTLQILNNGRVVVQKTGSATEVGYGFYNDVNTGMYSPGADTIALATGGNNRLHINSSGNVGIGTTSPSQKLHVAGNMRLQNQLYDSTNSEGTNGEVLTKVSTGTEWKAPAVTSQAASLYDLIPNGAFTTTYAFTSTAGTWAEVMEGNDIITATGTYSVQVFVDDQSVGGTQYDEYYSGTMSWVTSGTNDAGGGAISEIALHRAGHAANQGVIYLRTRETTNAETNKLKLEVMSNKTYTGASNLVFKFVRLI